MLPILDIRFADAASTFRPAKPWPLLFALATMMALSTNAWGGCLSQEVTEATQFYHSYRWTNSCASPVTVTITRHYKKQDGENAVQVEHATIGRCSTFSNQYGGDGQWETKWEEEEGKTCIARSADNEKNDRGADLAKRLAAQQKRNSVTSAARSQQEEEFNKSYEAAKNPEYVKRVTAERLEIEKRLIAAQGRAKSYEQNAKRYEQDFQKEAAAASDRFAKESERTRVCQGYIDLCDSQCVANDRAHRRESPPDIVLRERNRCSHECNTMRSACANGDDPDVAFEKSAAVHRHYRAIDRARMEREAIEDANDDESAGFVSPVPGQATTAPRQPLQPVPAPSRQPSAGNYAPPRVTQQPYVPPPQPKFIAPRTPTCTDRTGRTCTVQ